jgi:hypothetical protein
MPILCWGWTVALASPFVVVLEDSQRAGLGHLAVSRTAPAGRAALAERPRPRGRPRFSAGDRLKVIAAATAVPPGADTAWSRRLPAGHLSEAGISPLKAA